MRKNQNQNQKQKQNNKLIFVIVSFTGLLVGANMLVSNILATTGENVETLDKRKTNLSQQNQRLREQILYLSSLDTIEIRAQELGLQNSNQVISLSSIPQVAMSNELLKPQGKIIGPSSAQSGSEFVLSPRSAGN